MPPQEKKSSGIVVDGRERVIEANREEIEKAVRAKYADELATGTGLIHRWRIKRKIRREIGKALEKIAPPGASYARTSRD